MPADPPPRIEPPETPPLLTGPTPPLLLPAPESRWHRHARWIVAGGLLGFVVIAFALGWLLHHRRSQAAEASNEEERHRLPIVAAVAARRSASLSELLLPGSLAPMTEASIYARATGYVRHRYVDIGDTVRKGQVLAEIESPDLDAQVAQGEAAAAQARQQVNVARAGIGDAQAKLSLARVTLQRYEQLLTEDAASPQDVDQQRQAYQSAQASLVSAQANVGAATQNLRAAEANGRRLVVLQGFERVRAPFDGVVTSRSFDEGALIGGAGASMVGSGGTSTGSNGQSTSSGSGGSTSSSPSSSGGGDAGSGSSSSGGGGNTAELFRIAQVDRLRVYINVPQDNAAAVQLGSTAAVFLQQLDRPVEGRVSRTARAIDATSRTLLTEVQLGNGDGRLLPGTYVQVRLASERGRPPLMVPGETLIVRAGGAKVGVLQPLSDEERQGLSDPADAGCARRVHLVPVAIGRDYGTEVEISQGLSDRSFLIANPADTTEEGALILPRLRPEGDDAGGPGGGAAGGSQGGRAGRPGAAGSGGGGGGKDAKQDNNSHEGGQPAKGDDKQSSKQRAEQDRQARAALQQHCIEQQAETAAAQHAPSGGPAASNLAPAGQHPDAGPASAPLPGGPSDRTPQGIDSPSIQAPTQGAKKVGGRPG